MPSVSTEDTNSPHVTATDLMIVEDNDTDFSLLQRAIRKRLPDTRIHRAVSHRELVTKLLKQSFDLYIVDMGLPDAIGNTTIAYIRSNNETIPIIALTGTGSIEYAVFALKAGASNFFEKLANSARTGPAARSGKAASARRLKNAEIQTAAAVLGGFDLQFHPRGQQAGKIS